MTAIIQVVEEAKLAMPFSAATGTAALKFELFLSTVGNKNPHKHVISTHMTSTSVTELKGRIFGVIV